MHSRHSYVLYLLLYPELSTPITTTLIAARFGCVSPQAAWQALGNCIPLSDAQSVIRSFFNPLLSSVHFNCSTYQKPIRSLLRVLKIISTAKNEDVPDNRLFLRHFPRPTHHPPDYQFCLGNINNRPITTVSPPLTPQPPWRHPLKIHRLTPKHPPLTFVPVHKSLNTDNS